VILTDTAFRGRSASDLKRHSLPPLCISDSIGARRLVACIPHKRPARDSLSPYVQHWSGILCSHRVWGIAHLSGSVHPSRTRICRYLYRASPGGQSRKTRGARESRVAPIRWRRPQEAGGQCLPPRSSCKNNNLHLSWTQLSVNDCNTDTRLY